MAIHCKWKLFDEVNFKLYCYYALFAWTEQMWMFTAGMAFGRFGGDLQLAASAAFVASAGILIFGPGLGKWIDNSDRMKAALFALFCTKTFSCITTALLSSMLLFSTSLSGVMNGELLSALSVVCIFVNMVATLAASASRIIITKDWVVVICKYHEDRLAATNAVLTRIYLISLIVSPYIAGQIMEWSSIGTGCFVISLSIFLAFTIEYILLRSLHKSVPGLSTKSIIPDPPQLTPLITPRSSANEERESDETRNHASNSFCNTVRTSMTKFLTIWRIYSQQRVILAGISLALLYMTVLGFDSVTDIYAFSQGLKTNSIALVKGCGAAAGIFGTFMYPKVWKRVGLVKTGVIALLLQLSCLVMPVVSIWLPGSPFDPSGYFKTGGRNGEEAPSNCTSAIGSELESNCVISKTSIIVYLIGLALSRCGLWMADLTMTQLFQQTVAESERASVNSVQTALNNLMHMLKSVLVIFMPSPKTFGLLIILSWIFVLTATLFYFLFATRRAQMGGKFEQNGCEARTVRKREMEVEEKVDKETE